MNYVVGFMFSEDAKRVVLIHKNRPEWQAGKFNGVGGKIELNELPHEAMVREFYEETGVKTSIGDWNCFSTMFGFNNSRIYVFRTFSSWFLNVKTTTDEAVTIVSTSNLPESVVPNLNFLIPMAKVKDFVKAEITYA